MFAIRCVHTDLGQGGKSVAPVPRLIVFHDGLCRFGTIGNGNEIVLDQGLRGCASEAREEDLQTRTSPKKQMTCEDVLFRFEASSHFPVAITPGIIAGEEKGPRQMSLSEIERLPESGGWPKKAAGSAEVNFRDSYSNRLAVKS